jgi:putative PIN family toxin of toxin-antitoxin system
MRIVMDTDVLVAALRSSTGASRAVYQLLRAGAIEGAASVALFLEYEMVLLREEHLEATGLDRDEVYLILDELAAILRPVVSYIQWRPMLSDPDDERVFETALNGQVDVLVTFNVRDYLSAANWFNLAVLRPGEVLRRL